MQMVRLNENNNIIYSNNMKINYWDEIYLDDKMKYIFDLKMGKNSVLWMAFIMQFSQFRYYLQLQKMG